MNFDKKLLLILLSHLVCCLVLHTYDILVASIHGRNHSYMKFLLPMCKWLITDILTEWECLTGKDLARGQDVRTERSVATQFAVKTVTWNDSQLLKVFVVQLQTLH